MPEPVHTFRHEAMATFFEIHLSGGDPAYARQAAQAAFAAVDRVERLLSRFLEASEVSQINRLDAGDVVQVSPEVLDCLEQALRLQELTRGAFDPALGEPGAARGRLLLDREALLVGREGGPVSLDLGAIGKGFALDLAAGELDDWDLRRALLVGGGSSLLARDGPDPQSEKGWEIALGGVLPPRRLFLRNNALGSSGTAVKGEHIIDPHTGLPVPAGYRTWAVSASAADADALSTAWMVLPKEEVRAICAANPGIAAIVQATDGSESLWETGLAACGNLKLEDAN